MGKEQIGEYPVGAFEKPDYTRLLSPDIPPGESPLAEILRLSREVGFSFAGGLPDPATFPPIEPLVERAVKEYSGKTQILQYGLSGGFIPLCEAAVPWLHSLTVEVERPQDILITSGSQTALSLVGRVFLPRPGFTVAVESPTYLGALDAWREYKPEYAIIESDEYGMLPESLDWVLAFNDVRFVYGVPDFQNPSGITIPYDRRVEIAKILKKHRAVFVEDAPYRQLRFEGEHIPTIHSLVPQNVIFMTTTSKLLAPGLRLGFTVAPREVYGRMVTVNGARHLCASTFDQAVAAVYIGSGDLERHVPQIIDIYRGRRDAMVTNLSEHFPSSWRWVVPQGGMFVYPWGPQGTDTRQTFQKALDNDVAYVPGDLFLPHGGISPAMRLNFSLASQYKIGHGMQRLGNVLSVT